MDETAQTISSSQMHQLLICDRGENPSPKDEGCVGCERWGDAGALSESVLACLTWPSQHPHSRTGYFRRFCDNFVILIAPKVEGSRIVIRVRCAPPPGSRPSLTDPVIALSPAPLCTRS